jgi:hypothetical protein
MYFIGVGRRNDRAKDDRYKEARAMRPLSFPRERLSTSVDLRRWMTPVEQQLEMNTWFDCKNNFFYLKFFFKF